MDRWTCFSIHGLFTISSRPEERRLRLLVLYCHVPRSQAAVVVAVHRWMDDEPEGFESCLWTSTQALAWAVLAGGMCWAELIGKRTGPPGADEVISPQREGWSVLCKLSPASGHQP